VGFNALRAGLDLLTACGHAERKRRTEKGKKEKKTKWKGSRNPLSHRLLYVSFQTMSEKGKGKKKGKGEEEEGKREATFLLKSYLQALEACVRP